MYTVHTMYLYNRYKKRNDYNSTDLWLTVCMPFIVLKDSVESGPIVTVIVVFTIEPETIVGQTFHHQLV